MLERIFELVLEDLPKNDKYNIKYNKSLALNGLKQIIPNIINSTLMSEILFKYQIMLEHLKYLFQNSM